MRRLLVFIAAALLAAPAPAALKPLVSVISTSVDEGAPATVRATRTGDLSRSSSVIFSTSNASAISGTNYTARSGTLTFAPGSSLSSSAQVPTIHDLAVTPNLYFIVRLGVVSNATIQANGTVTVRNVDQPSPPPPVQCPDGTTVPAGQTCPVPPPTPGPTMVKCADEGGICSVGPGFTAQVLYGAGSTFTPPLTFIDSIACNNATLGDPLFGTVKACYTTGVQPIPAPPPVPVPPPPTGSWVLAPLVNDGYARCKTVGGCHAMGTTVDYNPIIAQQGEVRQQAWNGCNGDVPVCRIVVALWPVNHDPRKTGVWSDWTLGKEGWQDEWEGVAPAP